MITTKTVLLFAGSFLLSSLRANLSANDNDLLKEALRINTDAEGGTYFVGNPPHRYLPYYFRLCGERSISTIAKEGGSLLRLTRIYGNDGASIMTLVKTKEGQIRFSQHKIKRNVASGAPIKIASQLFLDVYPEDWETIVELVRGPIIWRPLTDKQQEVMEGVIHGEDWYLEFGEGNKLEFKTFGNPEAVFLNEETRTTFFSGELSFPMVLRLKSAIESLLRRD